MKFKMEVDCIKLMNKTGAALVEPGAPAVGPWIFPSFSGYTLEAVSSTIM